MKILITGGAGFIGSEIIKRLYMFADCKTVAFDNLSKQIHGVNPEKSELYLSIKDKCDFVLGDVRDYECISRLVGDCEYIIHLAAETGTGQSMYEVNSYNEVNIMGTSNLFQALISQNTRPRQMILASSRSIYGEGKYKCKNHGVIYPKARTKEVMQRGDFKLHCPYCNSVLEPIPTDEKSPASPSSLDAFSKCAQEKMFETLCPTLGIEYTIFRFQNVYGAGQSLNNPYTGILSIFSNLMLKDKPINIFEDGNETRDFINVRDVASAVVSAIGNPNVFNQIINLGSGTATSVYKIAEYLKQVYNSCSSLNITGDFRLGDIANNFGDIEKARMLLGFVPEITLENGLTQFCQWVKSQESVDTAYEESLAELEDKGMLIRQEHK